MAQYLPLLADTPGMARPTSCFVLLLLLFAVPLHAAERLSAVVRDLHVNGSGSPEATVARLQAVQDRPGTDAPLERRRLYHASVGWVASMERNNSLAQQMEQSLAQLQAMTRDEDCRRCRLDILLTRAQAALTQRDIPAAALFFADIPPLEASATTEQKQRLHFLHTRLYRFQGHFDRGIAEAIPAIELAEQLGHTADHINALNQLLILNSYLGLNERAEAIGQQAYALAERLGNRRIMAEIQLSIGFSYVRSEQDAQQLQAYNRVLAITEGDDSLGTTRSIALSNIADYWLRQSDWPRALEYADRSVELSRRRNDPVTRVYALTNRGVARAHLGEVAAGIADVQEAIADATRLGLHGDIVGIGQELVGIHERAGDYKAAFETLRDIEQQQQEITRQSRSKALLELQEKYSAENRQREIERLADANRLKEAKLSAQTWRQRMWAALALVLALAAVMLAQWLARSRQTNRRLSGDVATLAAQSLHDPLTGLFNRRRGQALLEQYDRAMHKARHGAAPAPVFGLLLLDLDHFKRVNDTYGHAFGDGVLVEVAQRLSRLRRTHDAVMRWGGEEFLLLLPDVRADALPALAERILQAIGDAPIDIDGNTLRVTASLGCLVAPFGANTDTATLLELADQALYQAKAGGRNRAICVHAHAADTVALAPGETLVTAVADGRLHLQTIPGP
ncbi:MAG: GGDEF domain-containing protein [Stenotrophomonas sp.]